MAKTRIKLVVEVEINTPYCEGCEFKYWGNCCLFPTAKGGARMLRKVRDSNKKKPGELKTHRCKQCLAAEVKE